MHQVDMIMINNNSNYDKDPLWLILRDPDAAASQKH